MSSISFDADFQTDKLEAGVKKSKKTITEWIDGVVDAGKRAEAAMDKVPGAVEKVTEKVQEQKKVFSSIADEMADVYKRMMAALSSGDTKTADPLAARLSELRAKLEDATKAEKDFNTEHTEAIARNNEMNQSTQSLTASVGKWALSLGGAAAILNILKNAFLETMGGMKLFNQIGAITSQVLNDIVSGAGLSVERMISTAKAAGVLADLRVKDRIETLANKDLMREYNELYSLGIDQTITSTEKINYLTAAKGKYIEATKNEIESSREELKALFGIWENQPTSDKAMANVYAMAGKIKDLEGQLSSGTRRLTSQITGEIEKQEKEQTDSLKRIHNLGLELQKANAKDDEEATKKAIEDAKLPNQLAKQYELLDKAVADGNTAEMKAISDKIVLLKKELDIRTEIAKAAISTSYGGVIPQITQLPGAPTVSTRPTSGSAVLSGETRDSQYIPGTAMLTDAAKANQKKKINEEERKAKQILEDELKLRQEIVNAVADLVNQIGQQIGLNEKSMALLDAGLNAFKDLAKGDLVGAAVSMLSGIIAQIPSSASRFEKQIEHINQLLEKQQRLIDQSEQKGGQAAARQADLDYLNQKAAAQKAEYERLQKSADTHFDLLGWRQDKADAAYQTWQDTLNLIEDSNQALGAFYTGTSASAIADAIVQGFQDGKTSAADFADTFNGFMTNAIEAAFRDSLLIDLGPWYEQWKIYMASDGGLSEAEKADLKIQYDAIIAKAKADRDGMYAAAGISPTTGTAAQPGLSGQISRSITEDTASELSGLMRRMADDERKSVDFSRVGVAHLVGIEVNTYGSWQELIKSNGKLDTVISKLGSPYTGPLG